MAVGSDPLTSAPREPRAGGPLAVAARHPLLQVVAVYLAARAFTTIAMLLIRPQLTPASRAGANPGFFEYSAIWDGQWYWYIAANGYPGQLPLDASGYVAENQWAFMPLYPAIVSAVSLVTTLAWPVAAWLVSMGFGFGAAVTIYRLFRLRQSHRTALFGVTLFAVSPLSFMLQMAYAESMQLFFLALALYLMARRRWGLLFPTIAVLALTRPTGLALALALGLYWLYRFVRREREEFAMRERIVVAAVTVFSGITGFAWLLIAWAVTGSITAYTDTELAWRAAWIGHQHLLPFAPWFQAAPFWVGETLGPFVVVAVVTAFAGALFLPPVRRLGIELRLWLASYGLYLFAVFFPQSSLLRLLMPMFPFAAALAEPRNPIYRVGIVVASLILQFAWLYATWGPVSHWWSTP